MADKIIHLIRHAEGEHNVDKRWHIPDAVLTPLGEEQCHALSHLTSPNIQFSADLLVTSLMRRTMQTMVLGLPELRARLEAKGKPPAILDILQEVDTYPCDTPTYPVEAITAHPDARVAKMFEGLDVGEPAEGYASKKGIFDPERLEERVGMVRQWLFERQEKEIVVVGHHGFLKQLALGHRGGKQWDNCQIRTFTFASADMSMPLKEITGDGRGKGEKVEPGNATAGPAPQD